MQRDRGLTIENEEMADSEDTVGEQAEGGNQENEIDDEAQNKNSSQPRSQKKGPQSPDKGRTKKRRKKKSQPNGSKDNGGDDQPNANNPENLQSQQEEEPTSCWQKAR